MSKPGTRITQDPRVMIAVLAVLAAMVAINLRDLLPAGAAAGLATAPDDGELAPPMNLRRVSAAVRACVAARGDSLRLPVPARLVRNPFADGPADLVYAAAAGPALPAPAPGAGPPLRCSAVILGGEAAAAIIDGRLVNLGDELGDYRVVAINAEGVTLRSPERTRVLVVRRVRGEGAIGAPVAQD